MDHVAALALVNKERARLGQRPLILTDDQARQAFASLQAYAHYTQRPIETAIADVARFQMQSEELERLRSQS